ncbi:MAG: PAS domain S-box protein, partial [Deltaproteobacteria bacterium]|nr:PAS domain S-box protein [Deltaproteobacteria bacterium]
MNITYTHSPDYMQSLTKKPTAKTSTLEDANAKLRAREHELETANQQLVSQKQQLRAAFQQLRAQEQQLRAAFQQLQESEKALRESESRYRSLIETMNEGLIIGDKNGLFTYANTKFSEMVGYNRDELVGSPVRKIIDQENRKILQEEIAKRKQGEDQSYEISLTHKNGKQIHVLVSPRPVFDDNDEFQASFAVIMDITERKQMESQLLQSEKLKSLGELASGVAHDFNNVLAAILGRTQLLRKMMGDPEPKNRRNALNDLKKTLEIIETAAMDGAETVRRIQEFSRKRDDEGYGEIVDLKSAIKGAVEFTKVRWKNEAESRGRSFQVRTRIPVLPPVLGSAAELREVFVNLINNSLDAMPDGGRIMITASRSDDRITVTFRDTGAGIAETILDRIFDPFFTTKGPHSTGLGMSVSFGIIDRHQGTIRVDSRENSGTTFTISLPTAEHQQQRAPEPQPSTAAQPTSILIVEDEKEVRDLLRDVLTDYGHCVKAASNGKEA